MQEDFMTLIEQAWETNFALVFIPIIACIFAIIYVLYLFHRQKVLKDLKATNMVQVKQFSKILTDRIRVKFRPFVAQGVIAYSMSFGGSNMLDISGALYLLESLTDPVTRLRADTCAVVDWSRGKYACFTVRGLLPNKSVLSLFGFKKWVKIARPPMTILWILILGLSIYNILLSIGMTQGYDPSFLIDSGMFGWYFSFFLLLLLYFVRQNVLQGFYGDVWVLDAVRRDVILEKPKFGTSIPDKFTKTNVEVFEAGFVYHEFIPPAEFLAIEGQKVKFQCPESGKYLKKTGDHTKSPVDNCTCFLEVEIPSEPLTARDIAEKINTGYKFTVEELSANMSDLQTSYEQLNRMLELKQIENSAMKDVLEMYKVEGVAEGIALKGQTLRDWGRGAFSLNFNTENVLAIAKPIFVLGIFVAAALGFVNIVANFLMNYSPDPGLIFVFVLVALGIILFGIALIIMLIKSMTSPFR